MNRAVLLRACPESIAVDGGWVVRHPAVPRVQHLNSIRLRRGDDVDAGGLVALAERWQAGLPHRRVVIEDDAVDSPGLEAALAGRGWFRERVVLMAMAAGDAPGVVDPRAAEIDEATLRALELELFAEANVGPLSDPEIPGQLSDAQALLRAGTESRRFAAGEPGAAGAPGPLHAMATLFLDPDVDGVRVAQLETVGTRAARRGEGLADAAVGAALVATREWGAERVVVAADAEDWPQVWYSRLGFATVARQIAYVRLGAV